MAMLKPFLVTLCLVMTAFGLASGLKPGFDGWKGDGAGSEDLLSSVFGQSRKLFGRHFFGKADSYLHSGYYPSIFDQGGDESGGTLTGTGMGNSHVCEFLGPPKDWIAAFGRNFVPSEHRHLGEEGNDPGDHEGHCEGHGPEHEHGGCEHDEGRPDERRELLPWFKLAAAMDPERPETYVVAAYWLRSQLKKVDEAEGFVRQGLRANPRNPDLLFELGRIHKEERGQLDRARNVWELALAGWRELPDEEKASKILLHAQLLGNLAKLEEEAGNPAVAIGFT